ncbi:MAG TPA: DUF5671 domain-containing protein [Candidatus Dormibacteraeota bacterium]|nr:DUF5671 domain-containing protein [Candidatus Dormibacteraeota bacterium]
MILRRLYLYLASVVGLVVLAVGLASLGATILMFVFNDPNAQYSRGSIAVFGAMSVVALPVWGIHFWFGQRFASRDPYERSSAIRHLYLYFVCLASSIAAMVFVSMALGNVLAPVIDGRTIDGEASAQTGWGALVFLAIWAFHFYIASVDRRSVPEERASATLRRWYMYVALLVGLLTMLGYGQQLLAQAWMVLAASVRPETTFLAESMGTALAGALMWGFHARNVATRHIADDRHSTLRAVEGFLAVTFCIVNALGGASQVLYYALARILGVDHPGGASDDILTAAAAPVSLVLVYGVAWFLLNRRLGRDAADQEGDRQAGVRRLYTNLVALISLAAWAFGAALLLGTLAAQLEAPIIGVPAPDWKDPLSLSVTLMVVGAAVWATHWRQAPWAADRQSLSRKLYVWAALLGSVLAVLGGGVTLVYTVLQQAVSTQPKLNDTSNLGFASSLAVIVVAAGIGIYHWRVLRADAAARPARPAAAPAHPVVVASSPSVNKPAPAGEVLGPHARRYTLVVTDASEDDVHQALASLPPQASYKLSPTEQAVDGH